MITCMKCNAEMPEHWQKLTKEEREGLKTSMGIKPVCVECLRKDMLRRMGVNPNSAENRA